jgi:hypothetical protein
MYGPASRPLMLVFPTRARVIDVASLCRVFSILKTEASAVWMAAHCKALLRTMDNVMSRRVKSHSAKPNPESEPRKLRSSVFSI